MQYCVIISSNKALERKKNELDAIIEFLSILAKEKPDVIAGHNSENFDWNFIIVRCQKLGTSLEELSLNFFKHPIFKKNKETVLLMASEGDTEDNFKPVADYYHALLHHLGWKSLGEVNAGGVFNVGDIDGHPKLSDCYNLGKSL